jgi:signal transduction histidine kinase
MRERVEGLGGKFSVESVSSEECTVRGSAAGEPFVKR